MQTTEEKMLKKIQQEYDKRIKIQQIGKRDKEPNLLNISNRLDEYYIFTKLKNYCLYLSYRNIVSEAKMPYNASDFKLMPAILEELDTHSFEHPIIEVYNQIRLLYENGNAFVTPSDFENLLTKIAELTPKLNVDEGIEIYSFLTTYFVRKVNEEQTDYQILLFKTYNQIINLRYGRNNRKRMPLPPGMYKNMVVMAIILKDSDIFDTLETAHISIKKSLKGTKRTFAWIEKFIDIYQKKIERKEAPNYVKLCKSLLFFEQEKYVDAYNTLDYPLHAHGLFINMDIKILYLKVLYEIETTKPTTLKKDKVETLKFLEAYRALLRDNKKRKKRLNYQEDFYNAFYSVYKQLYDVYYNPHDQKMKKKLHQAILKLPYPFKTWFLQKYQTTIEKKQ